MKSILGNNLQQGLFIEGNDFDGFARWGTRQQLKLINSEYKNFDTKELRVFVINLRSLKKGQCFDEKQNCIYVHKFGTKPVTSNINELTTKHENYYECTCNGAIADAEYVASFFNSRIGELIISSANDGACFQNIKPNHLLDLKISVPPIETQKEISKSIRKLKMIRERISSFENDLSVNPISSEQVLYQIDSILDIVGGLADADKIKSLIRQGESKLLEFKETLSLDVRKRTKEKYIEDSVIKTVAALLNTDGGALLVGVSDCGKIIGVEEEIEMFHKNKDKLLLHFKNILKNRIGEESYPYVDHKLVAIDKAVVLFIECKKSSHPIYVDNIDFYVRTNPATDKLDGPKMVHYITNHFGR